MKMTSIKNVALSALLTIGAFTAVTYTACNKDECKDVTCQNGGTCSSGNCTCPSGYEGTRCETSSASKIPGTYTATETCQPPVTGSGWSSVLTVSSTDDTRIVISNFGASGTNVTGKVILNAITIDETTIGSKTVTGTGVISGNTITITYSLVGGSTNYQCTQVLTKQ